MKRNFIRLLLLFCLSAGALTACRREVPAAAPETMPSVTKAQTQPAETEPREERFLLTFAGDCTLGTRPSQYNAGLGYVKLIGEDYRYPFRNVIEYFEQDEFSFVNLEGPLCDDGYAAHKRHTFRGPTSFVRILTENSVECVTLANNHTLDYGQTGYESTLRTLEEAGVSYVERDLPTIVTTKNGLRIGLYGATYDRLDTETITADISALKGETVDLVIFAPHWGNEGSFVPTRFQQELGHAAIDAGADIVCGSHPHVLQPVEAYNGGMIYYSLGNFTFGGNGAPNDYDTAILQQEIIRDPDGTVRLGAVVQIPASVSSVQGWNNFQPTPYPPGTEEYDRVLAKLGGTWHQTCIPIG